MQKKLIKWWKDCQSATQIKYSCYNILQQQYLVRQLCYMLRCLSRHTFLRYNW